MEHESVRFFDGRKFLWDGAAYPERASAESKAREYGERGFETSVLEADGLVLIYTRRVVAEAVVDGATPA